MWHAKGANEGPVDLDASFTQDEGFSKTQAAVLDLLLQEDASTGQRLYAPHKHIVWLDNLFTSVKLLERLRELGIGAVGTVRTTRTRREELGDKEVNFQAKNTPAGYQKQKAPAEQMDPQLVELKLTHIAQIPWGNLYGSLSKNSTVLELAWKDSNIVLFMSTVHDGRSYVSSMRKRPANTSTGARMTRLVFCDDPVKELDIPDLTDDYNCYMGGVDNADQLRSYYTTLRSKRKTWKTWKALFHFLLNIVIVNCYLLSSYKPFAYRANREESHKQFRKDLRKALFQQSTRPAQIHSRPPRPSTDNIIYEPAKEHKLVKLWNKQHSCSACIEARRKTTDRPHRGRRKALSELSENTVKKPRGSKDWKRPARAPRTLWGCSICRIPFCTKATCWQPYIDRLTTKD